ncbi:MAG: cytochrome C oxidase subunit IV family protein [Verrucomicrobiales bacterium]|nr:cytochrome C oxidase subunit IV family protein [Verrucomicrobiales bacterium]
MTCRVNGIVWGALCLLTLAGFVLGGIESGGRVVGILLLAVTKAVLVGFGFMELHSAHPAWKWAFVTLVAIVTGVLIVVGTWKN